MKTEVCIESFGEALVAQSHGINRIELCAALDIGGLTPSIGLIEKCANELEIETHVMIRPRGGNFVYSAAELEVMLKDIELAAKAGVNGVVIGALTDSHLLNRRQIVKMIEIAHHYKLETTFHRAFDIPVDSFELIEQLIELKLNRILTSGCATAVYNGMATISSLVKKAACRIEVMAGSGVNASNAFQLKNIPVDAIHFSIRKPVSSNEQMGTTYEIDNQKITSILASITD